MKISLKYHYPPPPLNCHRFFKRCKTQCLHLITDFFNVHIFECNNFTLGKALRGHHFNRLKSLSLSSLCVFLSISNYLPSPVNSTSKSLSHLFLTPLSPWNIFFFFFSFDYQLPYWSLQLLFPTTKIYSA